MAKGFRPPLGGGQANLMKQVKQMQEQLALAQQQLAEETVTASVGGGALKVTMSGAQVCKAVDISAELLKEVDVDMLQDLVLSAVNSALDDSRKLAAKKLGPLTGGIPGLGL
jgi:DNA-binding YbaB/EbfC family protein